MDLFNQYRDQYLLLLKAPQQQKRKSNIQPTTDLKKQKKCALASEVEISVVHSLLTNNDEL